MCGIGQVMCADTCACSQAHARAHTHTCNNLLKDPTRRESLDQRSRHQRSRKSQWSLRLDLVMMVVKVLWSIVEGHSLQKPVGASACAHPHECVQNLFCAYTTCAGTCSEA